MINPEKISILERTHRLVKEFAESLPSDVVTKKPTATAFSLTEIIYHLADVERLWHERFHQMAETTDTVVFVAMDPPAVAKEKRYNEHPFADGMHDWTTLRDETYEMARNMPEEVLHRVAIHPRYGEMVIFRMFDIIANHDLQHLEQMKRTLKQVTA